MNALGPKAITSRAIAVSALTALVALGGCSTGEEPTSSSSSAVVSAVPERLVAHIRSKFGHDPTVFTEGLDFAEDGTLFESGGNYGSSTIATIDPATGKQISVAPLEATMFGEGVAIAKDRVVQLTWKEQTAIVRDRNLLPQTTLAYDGEGWGLDYDAATNRFVMTNGSPSLVFRDPNTFTEMARVDVTREGVPVRDLNEVEVVGSVAYLNVWHSAEILRVDLATGRVTGVVDATELTKQSQRGPEAVLNGIAHRPGDPDNVLYVTGKNWEDAYEVEIVAA